MLQRMMSLSQDCSVVVVVDQGNHRLMLWRLGDGTLWKQLGSEGTEAGQFYSPRAVAVTSTGALVVSDERCVQVLTVEGAVVCVLDPLNPIMNFGVGRLQLGGSHYGLAVYPGTNEILFTDSCNDRLLALSWSPEVCCYKQCSLQPDWCLIEGSVL